MVTEVEQETLEKTRRPFSGRPIDRFTAGRGWSLHGEF